MTRAAILVLGMHRSGTSALTRALSLMGAALPRNLMGAGHGNELGHWEPQGLADLHDQMLAEAGTAWNDWRPFEPASLPPDRLAHYKSEIARVIREDYGDEPLFVLKDPRICRFVPLYLDVFDALKIKVAPVLMVRHPAEVAASLRKRDGFEPALACLYWLRHVLDSERATRGLARSIVDYGALLSDWRQVVARIGERCAIVWPASAEDAAKDIESYVSPQWRHHHHAQAGCAAGAELPVWADRVHAAMLRAHDEPDASAQALDAVAAEFAAASSAFGPALCAEKARADRIAGESAAAQAALRQEMAVQADQRAAREAQLREQIATLQDQRAALEAELAAQTAHRLRVESELDAVVNSRSWRATRPLREVAALLSAAHRRRRA